MIAADGVWELRALALVSWAGDYVLGTLKPSLSCL